MRHLILVWRVTRGAALGLTLYAGDTFGIDTLLIPMVSLFD
jgi:hypothetical protein